MQAEETIENGAYVSMPIANSAEYPFDAPEVKVELPRGSNVITFTFQKPELDHYLGRQKATETKSRVVDGEIIDETKPHNANTDFFDAIVLSAVKREKGSQKVAREYTADECRAFPFQVKNAAIERITNSVFEMVDDGEDDLLSDGPKKVRQLVGDPDAPSYTIIYEMQHLPDKVQKGYEDAIKVKRKIGKHNEMNLETEIHVIEKAAQIFGPHLLSIEGGRLEAGSFEESRRAEFLKQIDPMFQVGVIDCLIGYYRNGLD